MLTVAEIVQGSAKGEDVTPISSVERVQTHAELHAKVKAHADELERLEPTNTDRLPFLRKQQAELEALAYPPQP